jgi:hypothetical protein
MGYGTSNHVLTTEYRIKGSFSFIYSVAYSLQAKYTDRRPPLVGEVSAIFADRGVSRDQGKRSERPLISVPYNEAATLSLKKLLICLHEAEFFHLLANYYCKILTLNVTEFGLQLHSRMTNSCCTDSDQNVLLVDAGANAGKGAVAWAMILFHFSCHGVTAAAKDSPQNSSIFLFLAFLFMDNAQILVPCHLLNP